MIYVSLLLIITDDYFDSSSEAILSIPQQSFLSSEHLHTNQKNVFARSGPDSESDKSYEDDSQREHSHNTLRQLGTFITKMMVYEIERKTPRFDQLMQLENELFQGNNSIL
jgi:hypothetical protein